MNTKLFKTLFLFLVIIGKNLPAAESITQRNIKLNECITASNNNPDFYASIWVSQLLEALNDNDKEFDSMVKGKYFSNEFLSNMRAALESECYKNRPTKNRKTLRLFIANKQTEYETKKEKNRKTSLKKVHFESTPIEPLKK